MIHPIDPIRFEEKKNHWMRQTKIWHIWSYRIFPFFKQDRNVSLKQTEVINRLQYEDHDWRTWLILYRAGHWLQVILAGLWPAGRLSLCTEETCIVAELISMLIVSTINGGNVRCLRTNCNVLWPSPYEDHLMYHVCLGPLWTQYLQIVTETT